MLYNKILYQLYLIFYYKNLYIKIIILKIVMKENKGEGSMQYRKYNMFQGLI